MTRTQARSIVVGAIWFVGIVICVVIFSVITSCATPGTQPTRVDTHTETVEVKVPVPVPCLTPADLPPYPVPTKVDPKTATTEQLAAAAANDAEMFLSYAKAVQALLDQCTKRGSK